MFALLSLAALVPAADPLALKPNDRVVWIGGAVAEREQRYGHWETALLLKFPGRNVTVRNLGWSGDTVAGTARLGFDFDKPEVGFKRLIEQTLELKPTVIFISYGLNESFDGPAGVPAFQKGLDKLLDALAPSKARIVLFTPWPFEPSEIVPNPVEKNRNVGLYADAIREVAEARGHQLADLYARATRHQKANTRFTDNGMHLSDAGYQGTVPDFLDSLGLNYGGDDPAKVEAVRAAVRKKNELFFHRWRPQNETYLFGFRKHEQGKNAKEVAAFDPLVAKAEEELLKLLK